MILSVGNTPLSVNGNLLRKEPKLPPYTIRLKFTEGITPSFRRGTGVQVSTSPNIWDLTYENTNWFQLCNYQSDLVEVIDANTTGVTNMSYMFTWCNLLTTVPLFDTSSVTNMYCMFIACNLLTTVPLFDTSRVTNMHGMFANCHVLTSVPLFDTSKVTDMSYMLDNCYEVQSGALALYQQASTQAVPPSDHLGTFTDCGRDTITGAAELAQIPDDWK